MVTQEMLVHLGQLLKAARLAKKLNQGEVADAMKIAQGQYSDIERAYIRLGHKRGSVPDDDFLASASEALDIPLRELHAALGRVPSGSPAEQLVREHLAPYTVEGQISREQVESLAQELDDIARVRVERITGQFQAQSQTGAGKQSQKQKQGVT